MANFEPGEHILRRYDQQLQELMKMVADMATLVQRNATSAFEALLNHDESKGHRVAEADDAVDALELAIDEDCMRIMARHQPTAVDLRLLFAVAKATTDLERIGDEAQKMGKLAMGVANIPVNRSHHTALRHLGEKSLSMLENALDAFVHMDVDKAVAMALVEREVDEEYESMVREQITYLIEDQRSIRHSLNILWAARALERIAHHARNLTDYVVHVVKGKDIRHPRLEPRPRGALDPKYREDT